MNVLIVSSYPPRHCGIGAYARDQVAGLLAAGDRVTVLSPPDGDGDMTAEFLGGRAFRTAARMGRPFDRLVVHFQPALYYRARAPLSKVSTSLSLLWLVLRRRRTEILVHEADRPIRWRPDYLLLGLAFRLAPCLVFHTEAERREVGRQYGMGLRGRVIPHAMLPATPLPPSRQQARRTLGIDVPGPVFVCAGFIQPSKGFDRAVDAFASAGRGSLFVVGSLREETEENREHADLLARRCAETPGAKFVRRYLSDEDFDLWLAAADMLVLPYRRSWSSGVLARAHAIGTPAVVSGVGGLAEQAGAGDVVVSDDAALAGALRRAVARTEGRASAPFPSETRYARDPGSSEPARDPT